MGTVVVGGIHLHPSCILVHLMQEVLDELVVPVELVAVDLVRLIFGILLCVEQLAKVLG